MTIRHLKIFIEVARCGKMSKAAANLYISQPTVSQTISELESHYKVRLFERFPKSLHITSEGKVLLQYAKQVIAALDDLENAMSRSDLNPPVRVGATVTVGSCVIGDIVSMLEERCPKSDISVCINNTKTIEEGLLANDLDIALVEGSVQNQDLISTPVIEDYLVLVCSDKHPFAKLECVSLEELSKEPFILREEGSGTRSLFLNSMAAKGYSVREKWTCTNADTIKQAVMQNRGLSVISIRAIEQELKEGHIHIVPVEDCRWKRSFSLAYHKNKFLSAPLTHFIELAKGYSKNDALALLWEEKPCEDIKIGQGKN